MKNIIIKIIERHDKILDIINERIDTLVNFDWHADYPLYSENVIDIDYYAKQIDPVWYEENLVAILASKGYMKNYIWIFPHDFAKSEEIKVLKSKNGDCNAYNMKFDKNMKLVYSCISIDTDFFGNKIPVDWSPKDRMELLKEVLGTLYANDIILIISKSKRFVNYDIDSFLEEMIKKLRDIGNIIDIENVK